MSGYQSICYDHKTNNRLTRLSRQPHWMMRLQCCQSEMIQKRTKALAIIACGIDESEIPTLHSSTSRCRPNSAQECHFCANDVAFQGSFNTCMVGCLASAFPQHLPHPMVYLHAHQGLRIGSVLHGLHLPHGGWFQTCPRGTWLLCDVLSTD